MESPFFRANRSASLLRCLVVGGIILLAWILLAEFTGAGTEARVMPAQDAATQIVFVIEKVLSKFFDEIENPALDDLPRETIVFELPFRLLFRPEVFRHVILFFFAFWLAYKQAALYLNDLFDLNDVRVAEHYLLQTALHNPWNVMNIRDGAVAEGDKALPIYRIGGPGTVRIFLENAALFEKMDGSPEVIGSHMAGEGEPIHLDRFETLRRVIDLRDQTERFDVYGRSRDGIRIMAEDVQVVYSVHRDRQPETPRRPYPYQAQALQNLIYRQDSEEDWQKALAISIRGEFWDFLSEKTLSEFLATVVDGQEKGKPGSAVYLPRSKISDRFYAEINRRAAERGIELKWLGLGTWVLPAESYSERHQEARRLTQENQARRSAAALQKIQEDARHAMILRLIRDVPLLSMQTLTEQEPTLENLRKFLGAYHTVLVQAEKAYQMEEDELSDRESRETDPDLKKSLLEKIENARMKRQKLKAVCEHFSRLVFKWLNNPPTNG